MSLIINKNVPMMIIGFPTISDKYNVAGGVLMGDSSVEFGKLVKYSSTAGYYEAITETVTVDDIAGFVLGTNVKLSETYPSGDVKVNPGEGFNLLIDGFIAVELAESAVESDIVPNAAVKVVLSTGEITTSSVESDTDTLPNVVFTGTYEYQGSKLVAEIYVK